MVVRGELIDPRTFASALIPTTIAAGLAALLAGRMHRRAEALEQSVSQYRRDASHDGLTGLANRSCLERDLTEILDAQKCGGPACALLLLDLDRFKAINDTLGHKAGDELLVAVTARIKDVMADTAELYRLGSDEFAIVMRDCRSHVDGRVEALCRAVTSALDVPFDLATDRVAMGVSVGIAFTDAIDPDVLRVVNRADLALYSAKEVGTSSYVFHTAQLGAEQLSRIEIERDMARALQDGEFYLEYQPIVGVASRAVRSFEALLRWKHPVRGIIQPDQFVPLAEKTGHIIPIGKWVVGQACREAVKWPSPTGVAVNVAGDQFKDGTFVDHVRQCLKTAGLAPGRLTIEVTESLFTVDMDIIRDSLTALRALGVRIALDDFGTGFSSINNLKEFPLDHLKIDRSFAKEMLGNRRDAHLIDLILKLGETCRISTTIEGIETEHQMAYVHSLGVSEAQGYLFSKPVSAERVMEFFPALPGFETIARGA